MKALILHQSIVKHDAIGNDIVQMYNQLGGSGETCVYCDILNIDSLRRVNKDRLGTFINDKSNLIIYHHSQLWEDGAEILSKAAAQVVFKYHNITPEKYFEGYDRDAYVKCKKGREQTRQLITDHPNALWMGDSSFNLLDIDPIDPGRKVVVPPFNAVEKWRGVVPDEKTLKELLESRAVNLLFIGRVVPNKGHIFLFRVLRDYIDHYGPQVRLHVIGKIDNGRSAYYEELQTVIKRMNLKKNVHFTGEVEERVMLSYYLGSDFFLCGSEHEGFCIPLVEAQYCHLPVIARKTSAIEETLGPDQLLFTDDIRDYSSTIKVLTDNREYKNYLIGKGFRNYQGRFSLNAVSAAFNNAINKFTGASL
jgi:glycosyltransferase involved in cell wall biosynthesis